MDYERRNKRPESGELFVIMVYSLLSLLYILSQSYFDNEFKKVVNPEIDPSENDLHLHS
jgi:hypothetical protein